MADRTGKAPSALGWEDVGAEVISAFLDHLEADRHNSARSRNTRLAALRSLFRYAALRHPEHAELIHQVLAIPQKRFDKTTVSFLTIEEVKALLDAPDMLRWEGRRDPRPDRPGGANRPPPFGTDRAQLRRRPAWHRSPRALHREGSERTICSTDCLNRRSAAGLAARANRTP